MPKLKRTVTVDLSLTDVELLMITNAISQRLAGWADHYIEKYKNSMEDDRGPQHYITGFEEYTKFLKAFKDEFKLWESLCEDWYFHCSEPSTKQLMEYKQHWLNRFQEIQDAYDKKPK